MVTGKGEEARIERERTGAMEREEERAQRESRGEREREREPANRNCGGSSKEQQSGHMVGSHSPKNIPPPTQSYFLDYKFKEAI